MEIPAGFRRPDRCSLGVALLSFLLSACAGGPTPGGPGGGAAGESAWDALLQPRPTPLEGSARVTVAPFLVVHPDGWGLNAGEVGPGLALAELVAADLLRRRDVHFVERRRFAEAAERVRRGLPRPRGAPRVGRSPGAELILAGSWAPADSATAYLDLRLTEAETGDVLRTWRVQTPSGADPTSLARVATGSLVVELEAMGRKPAWDDPLEGEGIAAAPAEYLDTGVPAGVAVAFARGLAAEEDYRWEEARRAYQSALEAGGDAFFEARVVLARIARLRAGGTLGANQ